MAELSEQMCAPDFYNQDEAKVKKVSTELAAKEKALQTAYARWDELEAKDWFTC